MIMKITTFLLNFCTFSSSFKFKLAHKVSEQFLQALTIHDVLPKTQNDVKKKEEVKRLLMLHEVDDNCAYY